jgi:hypothetical protein
MTTPFTHPATKHELLAQVEEEHAAFASLIDSIPEAQREMPISGDWSPKDILSHVTYWEDYLLMRLRSASAGDPMPPAVFSDDDIERINTENFATHHLEDWHGVRYEFDRTYQEIQTELNNLPDEGLLDTANGGPMLGLDGEEPMTVIVVNTSGHYREHSDDLRAQLGKTTI